jgi:hypothetical protein
VQNSLKELIALLCFADPKIFGKDVGEALAMMQQLGGRGRRGRGRGSASASASPARGGGGESSVVSQLQAVLAPFILRRLKESVLGELTPKIEVIERVALVAAQRAQYDALVSAARSGSLEVGNTFSKLRKIANHPLLVRKHFSEAKISGLCPIFRECDWFGDEADDRKIAEHLLGLSDFQIARNCRDCVADVRRRFPLELASLSPFSLAFILLYPPSLTHSHLTLSWHCAGGGAQFCGGTAHARTDGTLHNHRRGRRAAFISQSALPRDDAPKAEARGASHFALQPMDGHT